MLTDFKTTKFNLVFRNVFGVGCSVDVKLHTKYKYD